MGKDTCWRLLEQTKYFYYNVQNWVGLHYKVVVMSPRLCGSQCLHYADYKVTIQSLFFVYYVLKTQGTIHHSSDELRKTVPSPKQRSRAWRSMWQPLCGHTGAFVVVETQRGALYSCFHL